MRSFGPTPSSSPANEVTGGIGFSDPVGCVIAVSSTGKPHESLLVSYEGLTDVIGVALHLKEVVITRKWSSSKHR